ncbi:DNA helicase [Salmonella phage 19]|nr:DNA helicase [Salmonella phage 19]
MKTDLPKLIQLSLLNLRMKNKDESLINPVVPGDGSEFMC